MDTAAKSGQEAVRKVRIRTAPKKESRAEAEADNGIGAVVVEQILGALGEMSVEQRLGISELFDNLAVAHRPFPERIKHRVTNNAFGSWTTTVVGGLAMAGGLWFLGDKVADYFASDEELT